MRSPDRARDLGVCEALDYTTRPMRIAYFDCIAGISGDMALAALIDAGADFEEIRGHLAKLPLEPYDLELAEVEEQGIRALRLSVRTSAVGVIRTYGSIRAMLAEADLPGEALARATRIFAVLAEAEAKVHRKDVEAVTFHEADAIDSLVDVVGTSVALTLLGVSRVFASAVPTGLGMARTEHGAMPIPSPVVAELLTGAPIYSKGAAAELTTATGAAILAGCAEGYGELPAMVVEAVGYGAGTHRLDFPDVLRVLVGRPSELGEPAPLRAVR